MPDPFLRPRMLRLTAVLVVTAALVVPGSASAKTFVSHIPDPSGDAKSDSVDITSVRLAYNRRTGALSTTIKMAGTIDDTADNVVAVILSDLVGGKCTKAVLYIGGVTSSPTLSVGQGMEGQGVVGKQYKGTGVMNDDTFSLRVKSRALAGHTVGCAAAVVMSNPATHATPTILDETKGNDGFFG